MIEAGFACSFQQPDGSNGIVATFAQFPYVWQRIPQLK